MPALLPEPPQGSGGLLGPAGLAGLGRPAQGQAQVRLLQLAAVQPLGLVGAGMGIIVQGLALLVLDLRFSNDLARMF